MLPAMLVSDWMDLIAHSIEHVARVLACDVAWGWIEVSHKRVAAVNRNTFFHFLLFTLSAQHYTARCDALWITQNMCLI